MCVRNAVFLQLFCTPELDLAHRVSEMLCFLALSCTPELGLEKGFLGPSGVFWGLLELSGAFLGPSGASWGLLGPSGVSWGLLKGSEWIRAKRNRNE